MPEQKKPGESNRDAPVDRRRHPRGGLESTDWETIVLKRVARHVDSLSGGGNSPSDPMNGPGWEQAALLALRRRISELKSG
jgi:hypothetical protein